MVGTVRIELPTSSLSRKRSPTELRACKTEQEWFDRGESANFERITWTLHRGRALIDFDSARDRFYYQFLSSVSTGTADGRGLILEPDQAAIKILTTRYHGSDSGHPDKQIKNWR